MISDNLIIMVDLQLITDTTGLVFDTSHMALPTLPPTTHVGYNNTIDVIRTQASFIYFIFFLCILLFCGMCCFTSSPSSLILIHQRRLFLLRGTFDINHGPFFFQSGVLTEKNICI